MFTKCRVPSVSQPFKMVKLSPLLTINFNIAHGLVTTAQNAPKAFRSLGGGLPWREAASIMLVSPTPPPTGKATPASPSPSSPPKKQPHFLLTKRSKGSGSFANILCFPGGNSCLADGDQKWIQRFGNSTGYNLEQGITFLNPRGEIPKIYLPPDVNPKLVPRDKMATVPKEVALRLTAIRETFEETGILLCRANDGRDFGKLIGQGSKLGLGYEANVYTFQDPDELDLWQTKIRKSPGAFMSMCHELDVMPDVNALVEWNNWLTPNSFGVQRYDTIFYLALLPSTFPLFLCPEEVEEANWLTPEQVLKDCEEKKSKMITPQIYELSRLRSLSMSSLSQLMKIRLSLGIERWCPAYLKATDGYLSVFPGDDLYPEDMKIDAYEPIRSLDSTMDELRTTSFRHHRIEYRSEFDFRIVIKNYKERAGQVYLD